MAEPNGADILFYVGDADIWWMSEPVELPAAQELLDGTTGRPLVVAAAQSLLGVPYVWGGASAAGVDCSGLVEYAYDAAFGKWLLHDADLQSKLGKAVAVSALQPGDLCCYDWNRDGTVDHIAIYIGRGKVIEASSSKNVVKVSGLRSGKNLVTCRSLFAD
jgi:cell wall-associated NlpC family hydrolase